MGIIERGNLAGEQLGSATIHFKNLVRELLAKCYRNIIIGIYENKHFKKCGVTGHRLQRHDRSTFLEHVRVQQGLAESCERQRVWQLLQRKLEKAEAPPTLRTPQEVRGARGMRSRVCLRLPEGGGGYASRTASALEAGGESSSRVCLRTNQNNFFGGAQLPRIILTIRHAWFLVGFVLL